MTNGEAINIIEDVTWQDNGRHYGKIAPAREIAISAIEKQTPKKPRLSRHYKCGIYYNDYYCPNDCASYCQVLTPWKFCPRCGQALDWSGTE